MYAQLRHMRIKSACRRGGASKVGDSDWYAVELTDGKNELYLNDVAINAGPVRVGGLFKITIEPVAG